MMPSLAERPVPTEWCGRALAGYADAGWPAEQRAAFVARLGAALLRYEARHGWRAVRDAFTFGRIVNGVLRAIRENRMDPAWGRRMLARRATKANLRAIAERGKQRYEHFAAIGRRGGEKSAIRRVKKRQAEMAAMPPHVREHASRVLGRADRPQPFA
jgi:hypothetical protein